jgi:hypothetical protein
MKKSILWLVSFLISLSATAQISRGIIGESNWSRNWTNFKPKACAYGEVSTILSGVVESNTTLYKKNIYLLTGIVYVSNNATLTIEPGTIIRGDYETCGTLVITKGAKLIANGQETDPIVFTSNKAEGDRKPGDWGGIIILGEAPINKLGGMAFLDFNLEAKYGVYGGQNPDSNSGILNYARIEFAGRKLNLQKELNGLSLAGVGNKTKLENIQISFSNDDSFECYGGDTVFNHLISFRATDDDFDFTQGTQCKINNSLAIRYPFSSDASRSRCFEVDSFDKVENTDFTKKMTKIVANNVTLVNNEENSQGLTKEAIFIKKDAAFEIKNSVISGFSQAILLENKIAENQLDIQKIVVENTLINNCVGNIETENGLMNEKLTNWFANPKFNIEITKIGAIDFFMQSDIKKTTDFRLKYSNDLKFAAK